MHTGKSVAMGSTNCKKWRHEMQKTRNVIRHTECRDESASAVRETCRCPWQALVIRYRRMPKLRLDFTMLDVMCDGLAVEQSEESATTLLS
jgi:hypothetical protein